MLASFTKHLVQSQQLLVLILGINAQHVRVCVVCVVKNLVSKATRRLMVLVFLAAVTETLQSARSLEITQHPVWFDSTNTHDGERRMAPTCCVINQLSGGVGSTLPTEPQDKSDSPSRLEEHNSHESRCHGSTLTWNRLNWCKHTSLLPPSACVQSRLF